MAIMGSLVAVSAALTDYPVYAGQGFRYLLAALILFAVAALRRARQPPLSVRDWARIGLLAATGLAGFNVCVIASVRRADPSVAGVVIGATPVALAVLASLLTRPAKPPAQAVRRRPSGRILLAALVVSAGAAAAQGLGHADPAGLLFAVGALAGEVGFSLLAVPLLPALGPVRLSACACAAAAPMLFVVAWVAGPPPRWPTVSEAAALGYLTVVVTAGAFLRWYTGLGRLGAERAGLFAGVVPVSAVTCSALLGTGAPGPPEWAGAALVMAGLALSLTPARGGRRHGPRPRPAPDGTGVNRFEHMPGHRVVASMRQELAGRIQRAGLPGTLDERSLPALPLLTSPFPWEGRQRGRLQPFPARLP
jgi:drug/metabolite transporter (DMT)-like permease